MASCLRGAPIRPALGRRGKGVPGAALRAGGDLDGRRRRPRHVRARRPARLLPEGHAGLPLLDDRGGRVDRQRLGDATGRTVLGALGRGRSLVRAGWEDGLLRFDASGSARDQSPRRHRDLAPPPHREGVGPARARGGARQRRLRVVSEHDGGRLALLRLRARGGEPRRARHQRPLARASHGRSLLRS